MVHTYFCITPRLNLGLRREFSWRFVVAEITGPIKGWGVLCFYYLFVHIRQRRVTDRFTDLTVKGASMGTHGDYIKVLAGRSPYNAPLQDFLDIIRTAGIPR